MPHEIIMPKLGLTMKTGTIVEWLKDEGDSVKEKEPLLEIETEKLSYSIESPARGTLLKKIAIVDEKYPIRAVLGYVGEPGEDIPALAQPLAQSPRSMSAADNTASVAQASASATQAAIASTPSSASGTVTPAASATASVAQSATPAATSAAASATSAPRAIISPIAKKIALEKGIDYNRISGSGPNGRIVRADVEAYAAAGEQTSARPFIEYNATNASFIDDAADLESPKTIIPYKGIRRKTGETMQRAWATIPMVTHHVTAPAKALMEYRAILNKGLESKAEQITIGELLLKLTAVALTMVPPINSSLSDEGIVLYNNVNLGIATATSDGLLVPVLRNAQNKGLLTMSREAKDLAARARNGALSPDDIVGATFTVSNLGGFDSVDFFTPIINPPQAAILGIGRVTDSVAAINGEATVIPTVGLSLTYDHRIIDGATAAIFIKTLMMLMDNPARAVLN